MKQVLFSVIAVLLATSEVAAQESGWLLRARTLHVTMQDNGGAGLGWTAENKSLMAVDVSYFLNKNVAVELFWPASQSHAVTSSNANKGAFTASPHALVLQYHWTDWAQVQPYLGVGLNNTQYSSARFVGGQTVDRSSWGAALQAGANFPIDKNWSINLDMKKLYSQTDVETSGVHQGTLKLNPTYKGIGLGYRF